MQDRWFAVLVVFLACQGLAHGQEAPSAELPTSSPSVSLVDTADLDTVNRAGPWASAEYLLWWMKTGRIPPLATVGGNFATGAPGTPVIDNLDFADHVHQGGRFFLGYRFAAQPDVGGETGYFFLANAQTDQTVSSTGIPVFAQPYVNAVTGVPTATFISTPGFASGTLTITSSTGLSGAEANLTAGLIASDRFHVTALGGFRYLRLEDEVSNTEGFLFFGNNVHFQDDFRIVNSFYGGQVGVNAGLQRGRLALDLRCKLALGQMQQIADVSGGTSVLAPNGTLTNFQGGLYALRTNIGRHERDPLAFVPEVSLNAGYQMTRWVKLSAGYSFLWMSTVARAGEQIDPVVNVSQFPIRSGNGPLVGPARPAFNFNGSDFWAQGLNLGLEVTY